MCACFAYLFLFIREVKSRFACHADKMFSALGLLCISRIINNGFVRINKVKEPADVVSAADVTLDLKGHLFCQMSLLFYAISRLI